MARQYIKCFISQRELLKQSTVSTVVEIRVEIRHTLNDVLNLSNDVLRGVDAVHGHGQSIFDRVENILDRTIYRVIWCPVDNSMASIKN